MHGLLKKLHLPAIAALAGNIIGLADLAARPDVAPVLPHFMPDAWATALVAVCTAISAVTKAVHSGDTTEVQKSR